MDIDFEQLRDADKEERRAVWVQALESGDYQQTTGQLRNGYNGFCCLGVACDIFSKATGAEWDGKAILGHSDDLPDEVVNWFGVTDENPDIEADVLIDIVKEDDEGFDPNYISTSTLSELNDDHGFTFPMIAKAIKGSKTVVK